MRYLIAAILCLMMGVGFGQAPVVGDYYGGGVVFWVNPDDNMQGLVCSIHHLGTAPWGCTGSEIIGADGIDIGMGSQNTIEILNNCSENLIAASLCANYTQSINLNIYDDWHLPSKNELFEIYLNSSVINSSLINNGGEQLYNGSHWSSTEASSNTASECGFNSGSQGNANKNSNNFVRAVRSYSFVSTPGCTDPTASNYYAEATEDDGSCCYEVSIWEQVGEDIDGEASNNSSGHSIAINSDGTVLAIGAYRNSDNGQTSGHVRIYYWDNTAWIQLGDDIDGEGYGDESGYSVSLSDDGHIVAIGAKDNHGPGVFTAQGHVRVYNWSGVEWVKMGQDIDGETEWDYSGSSVSLSSDGNIVAIGAIENNANDTGNSQETGEYGHVRIYSYNGSSWEQLGQDIDGESGSDNSGYSISLSNDGNTIAIGAPRNDGDSDSIYDQRGHVRIYSYNGSSWEQLGQDIDGETTGDQSGYSVSLNYDGTIVAIGAIFNDGPDGEDRGHVRVFEYDGLTWTQSGQDIDGGADGDQSGYSVSLNYDGTIVAIGAPFNGYYDEQGHVRVYQNFDSTWMKIGVIDIDGEEAGDKSGWSVSINNDGNTIAIGAPFNDGNGTESGHVRVYSIESPCNTLGCTDPTASNYDPDATEDDGSCCFEDWQQIEDDLIGDNLSDHLGYTTSLSDDGKTLATGEWGYSDKGRARVFEEINGNWMQKGQSIDGAYYGEEFGFSVSINSLGNSIAVGARNKGGISGLIRVYDWNNNLWVQRGMDMHGDSVGIPNVDVFDWFGTSLSISDDGNTVASGAPDKNFYQWSVTNGEGYVKVFDWNGSSWTQRGQNIDGEAAGDESGKSVSLSSNGNRLAIGAPQNDYTNNPSGEAFGHVRIFDWNGLNWVQIGQDIDGVVSVGYSGESVSLSSDGNTVAIGSNRNDENNNYAGHVRICDWDGLNWIQRGQIINGELPFDWCGKSVSISNDGDIVAIGSPRNNEGFGQVRIFKWDSSNWAQLGYDIEETSYSEFGYSVSISGEGYRVAIGAYIYQGHTGKINVIEFSPCLTFTSGCTDASSCNYHPEASEDDGSCLFVSESCDDGDESTLNDTIQEDCSCSGEALCVASECCISGTQWDLNTMTCVYEDACSADIAKDGFVAVDDLLELLSAFGSSCDEVATGIGGEECIGADCCGENTIWCETLEICIPFISCPADLNEDESIGSIDLLVFLPYYGGDCEDYESLPDCEVTASPWMCGDLIEHQGYDYSTVLIGEQCWYSENCRYLPSVTPADFSSDTTPYYYVYSYDGYDVEAAMSTDNYGTYGVLYNWPAVMTEGICPTSWHIPSDEEFTQLTDHLGGESVAGGKMKEVGFDHWLEPNLGATNYSSFNGLPAGSYEDNGNFGNLYMNAFWWSSTSTNTGYSYIRLLGFNYENVNRVVYPINQGFSARCIKD